MLRVSWSFVCVWLSALAPPGVAAEETAGAAFPAVLCTPEQTGGFHDHPEGEETYEPALFHPRQFELNENLVFMMNLTEAGGPDLYLTMRVPGEEGAESPAMVASACELVLEGLHLAKRLNKDSVAGRSQFRARA